MGAHFGDNANSSNAVLRYANVNNEPSNANTNIGSSLRVSKARRISIIHTLGVDQSHGDLTRMVKNDRRGNGRHKSFRHEVVRLLVDTQL